MESNSWFFQQAWYRWLLYVIRARGNRWLHPPFLYQLYEVYGQTRRWTNKAQKVEAHRANLFSSKKMLHYLDPGTGNQRSISVGKLSRRALLPESKARRLAAMMAYFEPDCILEMGASLGLTTAYLAMANPRAKIIALEGVPEIAEMAMAFWQKMGLSQIEMEVGLFADTLSPVLERLVEEKKTSLLVYLDGHHQYGPTLGYWEILYNSGLNIRAVVFDDIRWSSGMWLAWSQLKKNSPEAVWLDLGRQGWWISGEERTPGAWVWRPPLW